MEVYTGGVYSSGDIDLVYPFREHIRETLLSTGLFRQEGRLFISDELEIFLEIPGDKLWGDENRVLTLELGGGLKVRVIGIEDIIIDRLCACQHWDSRMDCELAELLLERYREELDWEYLKGRAAEEGVEEILKGGKGGRYG